MVFPVVRGGSPSNPVDAIGVSTYGGAFRVLFETGASERILQTQVDATNVYVSVERTTADGGTRVEIEAIARAAGASTTLAVPAGQGAGPSPQFVVGGGTIYVLVHDVEGADASLSYRPTVYALPASGGSPATAVYSQPFSSVRLTQMYLDGTTLYWLALDASPAAAKNVLLQSSMIGPTLAPSTVATGNGLVVDFEPLVATKNEAILGAFGLSYEPFGHSVATPTIPPPLPEVLYAMGLTGDAGGSPVLVEVAFGSGLVLGNGAAYYIAYSGHIRTLALGSQTPTEVPVANYDVVGLAARPTGELYYAAGQCVYRAL
jgi:hypothetical protein